MPNNHELCSKDGARWLAGQIELYWRKRGSEAIEVWIEWGPRSLKNEAGGWGPRYDVRSNMVNGLPTDWTKEMGV